MSRHRNVRSMRYSDEYDGYDDVYGHSVEDDYSISPSDAPFMYDRSNQQRQIGISLPTEENIVEEDEAVIENSGMSSLNDVDKAKVMSCLDEIRNVLGDSLPEQTLVDAVLSSNYDITITLDKLLNSQSNKNNQEPSPKPQRTPIRRHERGGRNRYTERESNQIKEELSENNRSRRLNFDVKEFLSSSKNTNLKLELSKAIVRKDSGEPIEAMSISDQTEKSHSTSVKIGTNFHLSNIKNDHSFTIQNMPICKLQMVKPSKLGYFICKRLVEGNTKHVFVLRAADLSPVNIIPFKFDILSPDDEVLSKRKW